LGAHVVPAPFASDRREAGNLGAERRAHPAQSLTSPTTRAQAPLFVCGGRLVLAIGALVGRAKAAAPCRMRSREPRAQLHVRTSRGWTCCLSTRPAVGCACSVWVPRSARHICSTFFSLASGPTSVQSRDASRRDG